MKTLLLMRHAKSSWKFPELSDHDRPLNKRGQRDAPMMGHLLVERELIPQRILSSSAVRARQTAEAVVDAVASDEAQADSTGSAGNHFNGDVVYQDRLYMAEAEDYLAVLREQPDEIERLMVIGHNPGLETLLQMLSGRIESLPTAVIAHIALPAAHWSEISSDTTGEMVDLWRPKELREEEEKAAAKKPAAEKKNKGASKHKHKGKSKKK